jgi:hypothetical protein
MRKPNFLSIAAASVAVMRATVAFAVLLAAAAFAVPTPATAGSGCGALLKAAKKGFRGDPAALRACQGAAAGGQRAARVKPRAPQSHSMVNSTRDLKVFKNRNHNDPHVRNQMRGVTALRRGDLRALEAHRAQRAHETAVNAVIILETLLGSGSH